jgi:hypothetical protein
MWLSGGVAPSGSCTGGTPTERARKPVQGAIFFGNVGYNLIGEQEVQFQLQVKFMTYLWDIQS